MNSSFSPKKNFQESNIAENTKILWNDFWNIATNMSRNELIVIWLRSSEEEASDDSFNRSLMDMTKFSKEDLLNILDEIPLHIAKQVIKERKLN